MNGLQNLWVVDSETGGIVPGEVPLIEVAYGPLLGPELTVLWNADARAEDCDARALEINRCFEPDRPRAPGTQTLDAHALAQRMARDLAGKVLIAANPQFDSGHMAAHLAACGAIDSPANTPWSYRLVELKSLVVGYLAARGQLPPMPAKGWGQADVAAALPVPEIPQALRHTAAGDVEQVRSLSRLVLGV